MSCSLHKTICNFIQYSKQFDLKAQENSISFYAWNKIYIILWQTPLHMVMYSNNLGITPCIMFQMHVMQYSWFCPAHTVEDCPKKFFNTEEFFLWVIVLIMLCFRGSSIFIHTEKLITLLFVLLQIQFEVYRSAKIQWKGENEFSSPQFCLAFLPSRKP